MYVCMCVCMCNHYASLSLSIYIYIHIVGAQGDSTVASESYLSLACHGRLDYTYYI